MCVCSDAVMTGSRTGIGGIEMTPTSNTTASSPPGVAYSSAVLIIGLIIGVTTFLN